MESRYSQTPSNKEESKNFKAQSEAKNNETLKKCEIYPKETGRLLFEMQLYGVAYYSG